MHKLVFLYTVLLPLIFSYGVQNNGNGHIYKYESAVVSFNNGIFKNITGRIFPAGKDTVLATDYDAAKADLGLNGDGYVEIPEENMPKGVPLFDVFDIIKSNLNIELPESTPISGEKYIALTFDDGPDKNITPKLLDMLKENGAKVTFFVLGHRAEKYPEILKRMADDGHVVGSHTYSHDDLTKLKDDLVNSEIDRTNSIIKEATGLDNPLIRPPYGRRNKHIVDIIAGKNMSIIVWNIDPRDWKCKNAKEISEHVISNVTEGDIILMHDIYQFSLEAAETVIKDLSAKGFKFVTVPELIANYGEIKPGGIYRSGRGTVEK